MKLVDNISRILGQIDQLFQIGGCALVSLLLLTGVSIGQDLAGEEILYPGSEFAKLDTFEGLNLEDAAKAIRDVIEYIEVSHLRGGPEAHSTVQDNYYGWKALQARAGKVLLKIHKPEAAPIPTFDPLDLE